MMIWILIGNIFKYFRSKCSRFDSARLTQKYLLPYIVVSGNLMILPLMTKVSIRCTHKMESGIKRHVPVQHHLRHHHHHASIDDYFHISASVEFQSENPNSAHYQSFPLSNLYSQVKTYKRLCGMLNGNYKLNEKRKSNYYT